MSPMFSRSRLALLVCTLVVGAIVVAARAAGRAPEANTTLHFQSGGRAIKVEYFAPATVTRKTAVVILHGAGGSLFDGPDMRRMARYLAVNGHPAYFVHYFDRTGTLAATDGTMRAHFDEWLPTVREGVSWVRKQEPAGNRPVAVYGYSLGAFLALAAGTGNQDIGVIVEQAGGIWYGQRERLRDLPPVLMVHGGDDRRVPFEEFAVPLSALLKERAVRVETAYYPGEGHRFTQPPEEKVRAQTLRFIEEHSHR